jgi:ribosome-associated translation inhibitor RaiA
MKIQFNTYTNIHGNNTLSDQVSSSIEQALDRYKQHITRLEIHLKDENGSKSGQHDQSCMLEARLEGRNPLVVTEHAATLDQAVHGATKKLVHLLDKTLGRLHDHQEKTSGLPLSGTNADNWSDSPVN